MEGTEYVCHHTLVGIRPRRKVCMLPLYPAGYKKVCAFPCKCLNVPVPSLCLSFELPITEFIRTKWSQRFKKIAAKAMSP
jgi:hypothetical protein